MRRLAPLLLLLCAGGAWAEEPAGIACGYYALVDQSEGLKKNGAQEVYDGLRNGLELARLPRVCLAEWEPATGGVKGLLRRLAADGATPVFAIGESVCAQVVESRVDVPLVMALRRYTAHGAYWEPLPEGPDATVVYASLDVTRIGALLRRFVGHERPRVAMACRYGSGDGEAAARFLKAADIDVQAWVIDADPKAISATPKVDALLHLRLGLGETQFPFEHALAWARAARVPLVTDRRDRFGQGAVVTVVASDALLGHAAAEVARRLRRDPGAKLAPRAVQGLETWVDLSAADAQGLEVPLPFLARADKIKRGRPVPAKAPR